MSEALQVTPAAPRIDARLVALAVRLDDRSGPIAETYRRVGVAARELDLVRPSYEQVRTIIHRARRRGRSPSAAEVLLDVAFRSRSPTALIDLLADALPGAGAP
ncbi:MAG: hypothetical protein M3327_03205 [Actinomycetota bacterium]|nr:hypothetical protein [Actinomycetota bacterium]